MQIYKQMESGTHGRVWHTDQTNNIAFSFLINANCKVEQIEGITIEIANTILETFKVLYNIKLEIKYPNDIVVKGKKIGGILTETKTQGEFVRNIVIGIGINTNQEKFTKEIEETASSIKKEFGIQVENMEVINKFCELFEAKIIKNYNLY